MNAEADIITLNNVQYDVNKMTDQQREVIRHVRDLDRQIYDLEFRLTQTKVCRESFLSTLAGLLNQGETTS
jgi:hypothetical protein